MQHATNSAQHCEVPPCTMQPAAHIMQARDAIMSPTSINTVRAKGQNSARHSAHNCQHSSRCNTRRSSQHNSQCNSQRTTQHSTAVGATSRQAMLPTLSMRKCSAEGGYSPSMHRIGRGADPMQWLLHWSVAMAVALAAMTRCTALHRCTGRYAGSTWPWHCEAIGCSFTVHGPLSDCCH